MRNNIILGNNETGERIYLTSKNKRNTPDRLQLKKYSPANIAFCQFFTDRTRYFFAFCT